jgi:N-acetylglutamate synthase-like GNAT family acetyltransferase
MTNQESTNEIVESSNGELLVRPYQSSDHEPVRKLFVEGMRVNNAPESYIERSLNTDLANIEETYMKDRGTFLVMERVFDNAVVATVGLQDLGDLCELRRMSVHASERRKGVGKHLISHFIAHARQHDFNGIKLSTGSWMESAMKFYASLGFEDVGRVTYTQPGESCGVVIANFEMLF